MANLTTQGSSFYSGITQRGLIFDLDSANPNSYSGTGTVWTDVRGGNTFDLINNLTTSDLLGISMIVNSTFYTAYRGVSIYFEGHRFNTGVNLATGVFHHILLEFDGVDKTDINSYTLYINFLNTKSSNASNICDCYNKTTISQLF